MVSDKRLHRNLSPSSVWTSFRRTVWINQEKTPPSSPSSSFQKPFVCQKCGKRYQSKTSLSLHIRLECGKDPMFQCQVCLRKFHQGGSLNRHIRTIHRQAFQESILNMNKNL